MPKRPASSDARPQLVQKPRSLSPPRRRKEVRSFSSATCAAKKILLRLQVWNLCAGGAQIMRAADCTPLVKKEYFLTVSTPEAAASGVVIFHRQMGMVSEFAISCTMACASYSLQMPRIFAASSRAPYSIFLYPFHRFPPPPHTTDGIGWLVLPVTGIFYR